MKWAACVVIVAASAACSSDPKLAVAVTHPVTVAMTTVTVYESESKHCTDIEFARLDAAALQALVVTEVAIDNTSSGELSGISRTGNKLIVARGYDAAGSLITAGCTEKGEIAGDDTVAVTTVIAALVSIRPSNDGSALVSITDSTGVSLADARAVTWTAYGPAGSSAASPENITAISDGVWEPKLPSCASSGAVTVHPNPASSLGGYAVQIRVAWAVEEPPAYTLILASGFGPVDFTPLLVPTNVKRYCAMRLQGTTHHLVCLLGSASMAYEFEVTVTNGKSKVTQVGMASALPTPALGATSAVALISEPTGTGTDRDVYAVTDRGQLVALFGAAAVTDPSAAFLANVAADAMYVPACGSSPGRVLIASNLPTTTVEQIDAHGGNARLVMSTTTSPKLTLDNAGCVTQLQTSGSPQLVQLATILSSGVFAGDTELLNCTGATTCAPLAAGLSLTKGAGVGFTGGTEPRLVATTVDATGVVLVEVVFSATNTSIERDRLPAAAIPAKIVAATGDGDTDVDLFWNLVGRTGTNFEIGYSRKVGNDHLEALSRLQSLTVTNLDAGDLDGNMLDDILVTAVEGVVIVPMGVVLTGQDANLDATCTL